MYRHLELGSVEILIGLTHTHKQTQRCTHEFIQKAAQGDGPDLCLAESLRCYEEIIGRA